MMTPKELMLELLKPNGKPDRQLKQYEALHMVLTDPVNGYLRKDRRPGSVSIDRWGTTIAWPEGDPGAMPIVNDETKVLRDITRWREQVKVPDLTANAQEGWEECRTAAREAAGDTKLVAGFMGCGIFEQCHYLMGFEDTLANLYEHPEEMHELIDRITDYRIEFANLLMDGLQPDVLFTHDDWGTKDALFMKPDMWREFFKEPYRRFYQNIRNRGVIAIHHADSYLVPILEDMIEVGIQVWQGTLPENNIPEIQKSTGGRMVFMGGIGAAIDRPDSTEEEIRAYVREALNTYCPGGSYIPSITYGLAGTVYKHVDPIIDDEIDKYNARLHLPEYQIPQTKSLLRSAVSAASNQEAAASASAADAGSPDESLVSELAKATAQGQKKKTLRLCEDALQQGVPAQSILQDGLVRGMTKLGEEFSTGAAFIPEMLLAAECMTEATQLLTPHLLAETDPGSGGSKYRIALGTVKGDLHNIGKNLVKIMMEGSGLEVVDLGVDVEAEDFIKAAVEQKCNMIACSCMLTTSMMEMKNIISAADNAGIRGTVKIMVGGAPITQEFADEIGADCYTDDAAKAAFAAISLLRHMQ